MIVITNPPVLEPRSLLRLFGLCGYRLQDFVDELSLILRQDPTDLMTIQVMREDIETMYAQVAADAFGVSLNHVYAEIELYIIELHGLINSVKISNEKFVRLIALSEEIVIMVWGEDL